VFVSVFVSVSVSVFVSVSASVSASVSVVSFCLCVFGYSIRWRSLTPDRPKSEKASKTDHSSNLRARRSTSMSLNLL
jgi:hypothetical protein